MLNYWVKDISALGLNDLMLGLKKAAEDDNIEGILLEHGAFVAGYGMLEELGEYFIEFKKVENLFTLMGNTILKKEPI